MEPVMVNHSVPPITPYNMSVLLLNGPPFSALFWRDTQHRLKHWGISSYTYDFLHDFTDIPSTLTALEQQIAHQEVSHVAAHGLAVPLALVLARQSSISTILSNGPLQGHKGIQACAKIPKRVLSHLLHPKISVPICASSMAFRRLVVNPYVMDSDTIVSLCQNNLSSREYRVNTVKFLRSLPDILAFDSALPPSCTLVWGDADPLFPAMSLNEIHPILPNTKTIFIRGGQHFHPVERPWSFADHIQAVIRA